MPHKRFKPNAIYQEKDCLLLEMHESEWLLCRELKCFQEWAARALDFASQKGGISDKILKFHILENNESVNCFLFLNLRYQNTVMVTLLIG